jgi:two-component system cell cycle sensor histidine kinase/response regulator CckA
MTTETVDFTGQGTILLVEDDESVRWLTARGLRSRGFTVLEACNGLEALMAGASLMPDLLVSDVVMPGLDGPMLLQALRSRIPDLKAVFISGYAFDHSLPENVAFLPKPFSLAELVAAVKLVLRTTSDKGAVHPLEQSRGRAGTSLGKALGGFSER